MLLRNVTEFLRRISSRIRLLLTPGSISSLSEALQHDGMDTDEVGAVNSVSQFPLEFEIAGKDCGTQHDCSTAQ